MCIPCINHNYQLISDLTLCMLGIIHYFCHLQIFFNITFFLQNILSGLNTIRVSKSLDPDQDRQKVGPDLDTNCLQRLLADDKCRR